MATGDFALTLPQIHKAAALYDSGLSERRVAEHLGASRTAVRSALNYKGVARRHKTSALPSARAARWSHPMPTTHREPTP